MTQLNFIFLSISVLLFSSCTRTASKTAPLVNYPRVTTDIMIGDEVRGRGTRAELLGFIRWGDAGRASFEANSQEFDLGGKVVKQSMQSAVYDALEGQPDHFIVDPHFHTVEHNFFVFKTATTEVVGRRAKNQNYRQVKRFTTDRADTILLEDAPQTVIIEREGKSPSRLVTSSHIKPEVVDSVFLAETGGNQPVALVPTTTPERLAPAIDIPRVPQNENRRTGFLDKYENFNSRLEAHRASYRSFDERLNRLNQRLEGLTK
jgi:hypothetical protein